LGKDEPWELLAVFEDNINTNLTETE